MPETALMIRQNLDLIQANKNALSENATLRALLADREAYIAELSAKLAEREAVCKTLRRQRNHYIDLIREQSPQNFYSRLISTCVAVFLMAATIYSLNTLAVLVMRWAAFH